MENEPKLDPQEEWNRNCSEAKKVANELFEQLEKLYGDDWYDQLSGIVSDCAKFLELPTQGLQRYAAYHFMVSSSSTYEKSPQFDLPGERTVMGFVRKKIEELKGRGK